MAWFSFILSFSILCITIVIMQRPPIMARNDPVESKSEKVSSLIDTISSLVDKGQQTTDELRCPEKWSQFCHSCYFLSSYMSTIIQANHTCDLFYLNNSRLMYIQRPVELFYAAHLIIKNDLNKLLLEVNPDLMKGEKLINILSSNDHDQCKEFEKKILEEKIHSSGKSTNPPEIEMANDDKDPISKPCDEIKWNVVNENSNILILRIEMKSNKSICSLSNADFTFAYLHMCQYVLDRCLNNFKCGKHGRCVNSPLTGFNCSCFFLYDGLLCDKWSIKDIQLIIAPAFLVIGHLLLIATTRKLIWDLIQWFINCFRRRRTTSPSANENDTSLSVEDQHPSLQHTTANLGSHNRPKESKLSPEQRIRLFWVLILSTILFLILIVVPIIHHAISNSYKLNSPINNSSHANEQCERNTIFRIDNFVFLIISIGLILFFSYLNTPYQNNSKDKTIKRLSIVERIKQCHIVEPIQPFYITDRYTIAAIITIQMFEILEILDETLTDISETSAYGIFYEIYKRLLFVTLNAFRYYPILASLKFQNILIRSMSFLYAIGCISHTLVRENSCMYWLSFSRKMSLSDQTNVQMDMNLWPFVYSFSRNGLYCLLMGYIGAEIAVRLFYDLIYIAHQRKIAIAKMPARIINQYSFQKNNENEGFVLNSNRHETTESDNANQQRWCVDIRKYLRKIYHWENDFRFTTVVVCTYAIAFTFLVYLTCMLISLYTADKSNYVTYLKHFLERLLQIQIQEQSFKSDVITSAILTMIIFGLQLVRSMQNYKDSVRDLYDDYSDLTKSHIKPDERDIIPKSVQYPAFILRYLLGGFIICFNSILFILVLSNIIFKQRTSFKWTLISIASALSVYGLLKIINQVVNKICIYYGLYSILLYFNLINTLFIGILSSIIRLITSFLVNILYMSRIDHSCFVQPLQEYDSAYMAFLSFIRWELIYTHDVLLKYSSSLRPLPPQDIPPNQTVAVELEENDRPNPEINDGSPRGNEPMATNDTSNDSRELDRLLSVSHRGSSSIQPDAESTEEADV